MDKKEFNTMSLTTLCKFYSAKVKNIETDYMPVYTRLYNKLPEEHKKLMATPESWEADIKSGQQVGVYNNRNKTIYLSPKSPVWVWIHELAHHLHYTYFNLSFRAIERQSAEDVAELVAYAFYKYYKLKVTKEDDKVTNNRMSKFVEDVKIVTPEGMLAEEEIEIARKISKHIIKVFNHQVKNRIDIEARKIAKEIKELKSK